VSPGSRTENSFKNCIVVSVFDQLKMDIEKGVLGSKRTREIESDDDDFKIHPKKSAEVLGTVAAVSNSWYENDQEKDDSDGSDDDADEEGAAAVPSFPAFPSMTMGRVAPAVAVASAVRKGVTVPELLKTGAKDLIASTAGSKTLLVELKEYVATLHELLQTDDDQQEE
jgi:hypothetical protein